MAAPSERKSFPSIEELLTNSLDSFLDASDILLKFANNILNNVTVDKYRQLRLSNPIIEARLLPVPGAMECLFEMGFEEDGEYLRYPKSKLLDNLTAFRDQLLAERERKLRSSPEKKSDSQLPSLPAPLTPDRSMDSIGPQRVDLAAKMNLLVSEQTFFHKLQSNLLHVLMYEEPSLQKKARDLIPLQEFLSKSSQKALDAKSNTTDEDKPLDMRDFLLLELLNWFKSIFFKWVDSPECSSCSKVTERRGMVEPNAEDKRWGANRVEGYYCNHCRREERFPRYNHPGKLLESRRGRCGEWANCFTLCCRALGFEARYVVDWTDHVWTEVFSHSQSRWLHCDPCENACDKPLMYETGWGKKLSYVIAFSKDDIKDVTWRYTKNVGDALRRRKECREDWLVDTIVKMRDRKQSSLSEVRRTELLNRALLEFSELLTPRDSKDGEYEGRQSGSLAWRLARGEAGTKPKLDPVIIKPSSEELKNGFLRIRYNCASDRYERSSGEVTGGLGSFLHEFEGIQRKEELDWKMVYLARNEGAAESSIQWKFDFTDSEVTVDRVKLRCESSTFENGRVEWRVCGKETCVPVFGAELESSDLSGERELTVKAVLTGGKGDSAWQHTQLFRQKLDDKHSWPLDITITFKQQ